MSRFATTSRRGVRVNRRRDSASHAETKLGQTGRPTLLWIDDFVPGLEMYTTMFEMQGYRVLPASSGAEGIRLALSNHIDLVVTDYEMPGLNGATVAAAMKTLYPGTPVLVFSGSTVVPGRCRRIADAICDKARSRSELLAAIHRLLHKKEASTLQPPVTWRASQNRHRTVA